MIVFLEDPAMKINSGGHYWDTIIVLWHELVFRLRTINERLNIDQASLKSKENALIISSF